METDNYNGWTNYATWRVKLEMVNGNDYLDSEQSFKDVYELSKYIKETIEDYIETESDNGREGINFAQSYAMAFLSDVNWYEIAESVANEFPKLLKHNQS